MSDPTKKISRVFVLRHVERDKANKVDPQTPTKGGEIAAYAMGMVLRGQYNINLKSITSSPQARATRTAEVVQSGIYGYQQEEARWSVEVDFRLNDSSSDDRQVIKAGVNAAKMLANSHCLETEEALFIHPAGREAMVVKAGEYTQVIDERGQHKGDHLVTCHGGAIDAAGIYLQQRLSTDPIPFAMSENGGMFDKVEGFCATYVDGTLTAVTIIRQPAYLKTLGTVIK